MQGIITTIPWFLYSCCRLPSEEVICNSYIGITYVSVALFLSNIYALCKCTRRISLCTYPRMMKRGKPILGLCLRHFRNATTLQWQKVLQDAARPLQKWRETVHDKWNRQLKHSFVFVPVSRLGACTPPAPLARALPSPKVWWAQLPQQKLGGRDGLKSPALSPGTFAAGNPGALHFHG